MKIALIDSGIGGLNTLAVCNKLFSQCSFDYLADTLYAPFGTQNEDFLYSRLKRDIEFLIDRGANLIIIACNSATTILVEDLFLSYKIPIIGVEPDIITAKRQTKGNVLIFSTPLTKSSKRMQKLIHNDERMHIVSDKALASIIESEAPYFDNVMPYFLSLIDDDFDFEGIVLGCTHYLFLEPLIKEVFSGKKIYNFEKSLEANLSKYLAKHKIKSNFSGNNLNLLYTKEINLDCYINIIGKLTPNLKIISTLVKII